MRIVALDLYHNRGQRRALLLWLVVLGRRRHVRQDGLLLDHGELGWVWSGNHGELVHGA